MRKTLRWIGFGLGSLIGLILLIGVALYAWATLRLNRAYAIQPEPMLIPSDAAAVQRGHHWISVLCANCHSENLGGTVIFDDPALGHIEAPNLTRGRGGIGAEFNDPDWVRAIRHGVGPDSKALLVMPIDAYYYLSDNDLGAIVAYLKSVPPVDSEIGGYRLTPLARVLIGAGAFGQIIDAEGINHTRQRSSAPLPHVTAEYGEYLVNVGGCRTCHGPDLRGGKDPDPNAPPAPDLVHAGELAGWTATDFINTLRMGTTPGGRLLNQFMPWKYVGRMSDDELKAVWLYLQSLPPK